MTGGRPVGVAAPALTAQKSPPRDKNKRRSEQFRKASGIALKNGNVMQLHFFFAIKTTLLHYVILVSVVLWLMAAERAAKDDNHEKRKDRVSVKYVLFPRLLLIMHVFAERSFGTVTSDHALSVSMSEVSLLSPRIVSVTSLLLVHVVAAVPPGFVLHVSLVVMKITFGVVFFTYADNVSSVLSVVFPLRLVSLSHVNGRLHGFPLRFRSLPA